MSDGQARSTCPRCGGSLRPTNPKRSISDPSQRLKCNPCGFAWGPLDLARTSGSTTVTPAERALSLAATHERAVKQVTQGLGLLLLGAVITGGSYLLASGGGAYYVTTGAIIFGGFRFLSGVAGIIEARRGLSSLGTVPTSTRTITCAVCNSRVKLGEQRCPNCLSEM